jgi:hypothetical protein
MEFMDEKTKSIWKKSLKGWQALLLSSAMAFAVVKAIGWLVGADAGLTLGFAGILIVVSWVLACGVCLFRWLFRWFNLKRSLFGLACFATLIALIYAEEDWRGWHAWNKFKHEWEAKGEKFSWQSIVPPPVPDDQNFAFSPVWIAEMRNNFLDTPKRAEAWYGNRIYSEEVAKLLPLMPVSVSGLVGKNWWSVEYSPDFPKVSGQWATASLTDLKPWQSYYRGLEKTNPAVEIPIAPQPQSPAAAVLLALSKFDPIIEQMRQDSARPYSRFPLGYDDEDKASILLPDLAAVKRYSQVLQLRAIAELQEGQADRAMADVKLALRVMDVIHSEPFLISHLVRIAVLQITLQPIYEGLAEHKWSDAQLAGLETELAESDFVADYGLAVRGEMGFQDGLFDYLRHHPEELSNMSGNFPDKQPPLPDRILIHLIPSGWFYQNQLRCAQMMVELNLPVADASQQTISPKAVHRAGAASQANIRRVTPYNFLERLIYSSFGSSAEKFAYAQSSVDLARTAIALERYRLAHGEYPESLDALAPQFIAKLPHDVIGGGPLKYRRTSDGQFVLYSVGWNETDNGGVVVLQKSSQPRDEGPQPGVDLNQGNWVWRYPKPE